MKKGSERGPFFMHLIVHELDGTDIMEEGSKRNCKFHLAIMVLSRICNSASYIFGMGGVNCARDKIPATIQVGMITLAVKNDLNVPPLLRESFPSRGMLRLNYRFTTSQPKSNLFYFSSGLNLKPSFSKKYAATSP
jgi:hypothetical protein